MVIPHISSPYNPLDRLKLLQALNPIGSGKARKLNLSNAFLVTEDVPNNAYNMDVDIAGNIPATVVYDDQATTYGNFDQVFPDGYLGIKSPGTGKYWQNGDSIPADVDIVWPAPVSGTTRTVQYQEDLPPSTGMPMPADQRYGSFQAVNGTSSIDGEGLWQGSIKSSGSATFGSGLDNTKGPYSILTTNNTDAAFVNISPGTLYTIRNFNPVFQCKVQLGGTASRRCVWGFSTATTMVTNSDTKLANADSGILFRYSSGADSGGNWKLLRNDGSGAMPAAIDTGVAANTTGINTFLIQAIAASNKWQWSINGGTLNDLTTRIPAATTALTTHVHTEAIGSNATGTRVYWGQIMQDK